MQELYSFGHSVLSNHEVTTMEILMCRSSEHYELVMKQRECWSEGNNTLGSLNFHHRKIFGSQVVIHNLELQNEFDTSSQTEVLIENFFIRGVNS